MNPTFAFVGGLLLIWIVASGKAGAVWSAITGTKAATTTAPTTGGGSPRPLDPSDPAYHNVPYYPPTTG